MVRCGWDEDGTPWLALCCSAPLILSPQHWRRKVTLSVDIQHSLHQDVPPSHHNQHHLEENHQLVKMISDTLQLPAPHNMISQDQVNSIDPLENQLCRVCDEKAAGFHFGAFTCEGCKSFFGRFCNNQTVIPDCKNNYMCVIDKRNRTSCKACRLKKCLSVGMSKSGCRYGRRSNWFKIHCLMQKNAQKPASSPVVAPRPSLPMPRPILAPAPVYSSLSSPTKPLLSSRSPSPLNTSLESSSTSTQSSPSPNSDRIRSSTAQDSVSPTQLPHLPAYLSHLASASAAPVSAPVSSPLSLPLFDPLSLYRLSPLLALSSHLAQVQAQQQQQQQQQSPPVLGMDFKQTLDLLAERRALFEKLKSEALCSSPTSDSNESTESVPVDLSVK